MWKSENATKLLWIYSSLLHYDIYIATHTVVLACLLIHCLVCVIDFQGNVPTSPIHTFQYFWKDTSWRLSIHLSNPFQISFPNNHQNRSRASHEANRQLKLPRKDYSAYLEPQLKQSRTRKLQRQTEAFITWSGRFIQLLIITPQIIFSVVQLQLEGAIVLGLESLCHVLV